MVLYPEALPYIPAAATYADEYLLTAAGQRNRNRTMEFVSGNSDSKKNIDVDHLPFAVQELLFDPQTSGGLLIAVAPGEAEELVSSIRQNGDTNAVIIGEVAPKAEKPVLFR
jgi:selenide,water dikinase